MVCRQLQRLELFIFVIVFETLGLLVRGFFVLKKNTKNLEVQKITFRHIPNKTGNEPKSQTFPVLFVLLVGGQFWK